MSRVAHRKQGPSRFPVFNLPHETTESRSTRGQTGWSRRVVPLDGVTEAGSPPLALSAKKWESRSRAHMSPSATADGLTTPTTPPRRSRNMPVGRGALCAWRTQPDRSRHGDDQAFQRGGGSFASSSANRRATTRHRCALPRLCGRFSHGSRPEAQSLVARRIPMPQLRRDSFPISEKSRNGRTEFVHAQRTDPKHPSRTTECDGEFQRRPHGLNGARVFGCRRGKR